MKLSVSFAKSVSVAKFQYLCRFLVKVYKRSDGGRLFAVAGFEVEISV